MGINTPQPYMVELTSLLLDAGASATEQSSDHGMDAFTVALLAGHTQCAELMFERGYPANFSWAGAGLGDMGLVRAFFGESDDARLSADQRADRLGEEAGPHMNCAFLVAAINGQTEVVEYLLNQGVDVNLQPPCRHRGNCASLGHTAWPPNDRRVAGHPGSQPRCTR